MSRKLDQASQNLKEQFAKAVAAKQQQAQQGKESEMIKNDRPGLKHTPPSNMRQEPDRQSYNEKLAQERERALKINELAKARIDQQKQLELKNDREKDNDDRGR